MHLKLCKFLNKNHRFYFYLVLPGGKFFCQQKPHFLWNFRQNVSGGSFFQQKLSSIQCLKYPAGNFFSQQKFLEEFPAECFLQKYFQQKLSSKPFFIHDPWTRPGHRWKMIFKLFPKTI